jgi:hypothetical protein
MELQTLLNKLNKVEFNNSKDQKTIQGLLGTNKVEVSIRTELAGTMVDIERMPVQIVLIVKINGAVAITWGSESNEQNSKIVEFFVKERAKAITKEMKQEDHEREIAKVIFSTM